MIFFKSIKTWQLVAIVAVILLVLAAALYSQPAPPIRVGVLHSLSGTMAVSEAPLVDAVRLAVEEINASGGLLGRPVEMVVADGRSDDGVFATEAERLIVQEKVSVLFACWTSASRKAVKPVVEKYRHLMFYPIQYEGLEKSSNIVYLGATPNQQIIPGTRWAIDNLGSAIYLVGSDYIFPHCASLFMKDVAAADNATILGERYLPLGATEFEAVIEDIRRLKPAVVLNTINGDSNLYFFRALKAAGLENIPVLSFSLSEAELQTWGPQTFHPAHYAVWNYFQSLAGGANQRFVASFQARFGKERVTSDPIEASYNSVRLWASAVREAGNASTDAITPNIGQQSVPGPSGVVALDAATRHSWRLVRIGRARADGQFEVLQTSSWPVRPEPFPAYRSVDEWQNIVAPFLALPGPQP